jgi:hypothetical protein
MGLDINNLLSSVFSGNEINLLNSSGVDISGFTKNFKSLLDSGIDSIKFTDDLEKLNKLGLNVKSLSDLEKVKNLDTNKLIANSIDIKSLQSNLSKLQNTGIDLGNFTDQISKIKTSGLSLDKLTNFASNFDISKLTGNITQNISNITNGLNVSNLTGQASNLVGGLTSKLGNVTGSLNLNTSNFNNLTTGLKGTLTNNLSLNSLKGAQSSLAPNTNVVPTQTTKALKILVPSQYLDVYVLSKWGGESALVTTKESKQMVWYDKDFDRPDFVPSNLTAPAKSNDDGTGDFGINIHLGYPGGKKVGNWSEDGSQCFSTSDELKDFFALCEKHVTLNGNKFSYTLATKDDWEQATKNVQANKLISPSTVATQSTPVVITPVSIDNKAMDTSLTKPDSPLTVPNQTNTNTNNLTNNNTQTTGVTQSKTTDTSKSNIVKPSFFKSILDVISFQIWANKHKKSLGLDTDGKWGESTNNAWVSLKKTYMSSLNGITDTEQRLVHARLFPYGATTPLNKSFIYQASFSKTKLSDNIDYSLDYTINFFDNGRFTIYDNHRQFNVVKGSYSNGGRTIAPTEGLNTGKVFKDDNAWNAIRKAIS